MLLLRAGGVHFSLYCRHCRLCLSLTLICILSGLVHAGVYGYPIRDATEIALETVDSHLSTSTAMQVIFSVFSDKDRDMYLQVAAERLAAPQQA